MAPSRLPRLSPSELEIMNTVWSAGEATINEVMAQINGPRKTPVRRTTIQVQMARLERKGWLTHREHGKTYHYHATRAKGDAASEIVADLNNRVFRGSCVDLVTSLFERTKVSRDDIARLRKLIDSQAKRLK